MQLIANYSVCLNSKIGIANLQHSHSLISDESFCIVHDSDGYTKLNFKMTRLYANRNADIFENLNTDVRISPSSIGGYQESFERKKKCRGPIRTSQRHKICTLNGL